LLDENPPHDLRHLLVRHEVFAVKPRNLRIQKASRDNLANLVMAGFRMISEV